MRCIDCHNFRSQRKSEDWLSAHYPDSILWQKKITDDGWAVILWCRKNLLPREYYIKSYNLKKMAPKCEHYYLDLPKRKID